MENKFKVGRLFVYLPSDEEGFHEYYGEGCTPEIGERINAEVERRVMAQYPELAVITIRSDRPIVEYVPYAGDDWGLRLETEWLNEVVNAIIDDVLADLGVSEPHLLAGEHNA